MSYRYGDSSRGDLGREIKIPEYVYINFSPIFASLVFTAPNRNVDLPENPELQPSPNKISVKVKNNGRWQTNQWDDKQLDGKDFKVATEIESVNWNGKEYAWQDIVQNKEVLLNEFYTSILGGQQQVEQLKSRMPYQKDSYLFRAISQTELYRLLKEKSKYVTHTDPGANFESEEMYDKAGSQVKMYAKQSEDASGYIIRWKIEDPLFYRPAGLGGAPRVVPAFSHYLPKEIEISKDGISFQTLDNFVKEQNQ